MSKTRKQGTNRRTTRTTPEKTAKPSTGWFRGRFKQLTVLVVVLALGIGLTFYVRWTRNIANPECYDAVFGESRTTVQMGTRSDNFVYQKYGYDDDGSPRVVKTVLRNDVQPFVTPESHYVLYEYYNRSGVRQKDNMVLPATQTQMNVEFKSRVRIFASDGAGVQEHMFYRADGTLAARLLESPGIMLFYGTDGSTVEKTVIIGGGTVL